MERNASASFSAADGWTSWKAWSPASGLPPRRRWGLPRRRARRQSRRQSGADPGNLGEGRPNRSTHAWNVPQGIGHRQSGGCVVTERPRMRRIRFRLRSVLVAVFFCGPGRARLHAGHRRSLRAGQRLRQRPVPGRRQHVGGGTLRGSRDHHPPRHRRRRRREPAGGERRAPAERAGGSGRVERAAGRDSAGGAAGTGAGGTAGAAAGGRPGRAARRGLGQRRPRRRGLRRSAARDGATPTRAPTARSFGRDRFAQLVTNRTSEISYSRVPLPVLSVTDSPRSRPIMARASGAETAMRPALMSASWSPTTM